MPLTMRWVGEDELNRVAETRWMCYAHARSELEQYQQRIHNNPWARSGDYLLAEENGIPLGTATSLPMTMWVRGAPISCQGVAWVGTIKSARRRGADSGVASAVMRELLRAARERQFIVSALMPFRASFYEHFGYGVVERRADWTIPMSILPGGDCSGWRFEQPEDREAKARQWQTSVEVGQCDIERPAERWENLLVQQQEGMSFVDRPDPRGPVRASAFLSHENLNGKSIVWASQWSADSPGAFVGLLRFLGTLRDQYSAAEIRTPVSWPIQRLLRESQIAHRPVEHHVAGAKIHTRMQLRILDHRRYLESLHVPQSVTVRVSVSIAENEGTFSRLSLKIEGGKVSVSNGGATDFECSDCNWAAIATGDLPATLAVRLGLAKESTAGAAGTLDALFAGSTPFCREAF